MKKYSIRSTNGKNRIIKVQMKFRNKMGGVKCRDPNTGDKIQQEKNMLQKIVICYAKNLNCGGNNSQHNVDIFLRIILIFFFCKLSSISPSVSHHKKNFFNVIIIVYFKINENINTHTPIFWRAIIIN